MVSSNCKIRCRCGIPCETIAIPSHISSFSNKNKDVISMLASSIYISTNFCSRWLKLHYTLSPLSNDNCINRLTIIYRPLFTPEPGPATHSPQPVTVHLVHGPGSTRIHSYKFYVRNLEHITDRFLRT